jgi:hypothetical protein
MRGAVQMQITTIGLDIAKNVFQVHGIDAKEKVVMRKQLAYRIRTSMCREKIHLFDKSPELGFA